MFYGYRPYVPVARRRLNASREVKARKKDGQPTAPVVIEGRTIARTFWGKAWCENLERYSDYANRLPRGRTYVRNGSVVDLQIAAGKVAALVSGSDLYEIAITVAPVSPARWDAIRTDCAGGIDSLVELLAGRLSKGVMERICREKTGLFPAPSEIKLSCSCPDWASMCKHVAAVLYGVGARLDTHPELLFRLRGVHEAELVAQASRGLPLAGPGPAADRVLVSDDLSGLFGVDFEEGEAPAPAPKAKSAKPKVSAEEKALRKAIAAVEARLAALRSEEDKAAVVDALETGLVSARARLAGLQENRP